ncbi:hypothetical protein [Streptomyces sp. NBC_00996]|uniref:hypothetical protein n=1 Tax=Streptomyces sp. NBC_00996 TaxID=2903710 RepID=UPI003867D590
MLGHTDIHAAHGDRPVKPSVIVLRGNHDNQARAGTHQRVVLGVEEEPYGAAAARFAFEEAEVRKVALDAVRAWRYPAHESADHRLLAGEPARFH